MPADQDALQRGAVVRLAINSDANMAGEGVYKNERRWVLIQATANSRWLAAYASSGHEDTLLEFGLPGVSLDKESAKSVGFTEQVSVYPAVMRHIPTDDIVSPTLGQFQPNDIQALLVALDLGLGLGLGRGGEETNFYSSIRGMIVRDPHNPSSAYVVLGPHDMVKSETIPRPMHLMIKVDSTSVVAPGRPSKTSVSLQSDSGSTYVSMQGGIDTVKLIDDDLVNRLLKDSPPDRLTLKSIKLLDQMIFETMSLDQAPLLNKYPIAERSPQEWHEKGMKMLEEACKNSLLADKLPRRRGRR